MNALKPLLVAALLAPLISCAELVSAVEDAAEECDDHAEVLYDVYYSISFADPDNHYDVRYRDENGDMVEVEGIRSTSWQWSDPFFEPGSSLNLMVSACSDCLTGTTRLIMEIVVDDEVAATREISEQEDGEIPFKTVQTLNSRADECPS